MEDSDWKRAGWISRSLVGFPIGLIVGWIMLTWGYRFAIGSGDALGGISIAAVGFLAAVGLVWLAYQIKARFGSWWK